MSLKKNCGDGWADFVEFPVWRLLRLSASSKLAPWWQTWCTSATTDARTVPCVTISRDNLS